MMIIKLEMLLSVDQDLKMLSTRSMVKLMKRKVTREKMAWILRRFRSRYMPSLNLSFLKSLSSAVLLAIKLQAVFSNDIILILYDQLQHKWSFEYYFEYFLHYCFCDACGSKDIEILSRIFIFWRHIMWYKRRTRWMFWFT